VTGSEHLEHLDRARGGPFRYRVDGEVFTAPDPADLPYETILGCLHLHTLPGLAPMSLWQRHTLISRWKAHYDLPDAQQAQRLAFVVNRYRDDLEYDLRVHARLDLGETWRARRWRSLLAAIDRLPGHSYYSEALTKDPEHAKMLAEQMAASSSGDAPSDRSPLMRTWTPEVAILTDVLDAVRRLEWATFAVLAGPKAGKPPKPSPRPNSELSKAAKQAEFERRDAAHQKLADRILMRRRKKSAAEGD
jgi:hypothetical protein